MSLHHRVRILLLHAELTKAYNNQMNLTTRLCQGSHCKKNSRKSIPPFYSQPNHDSSTFRFCAQTILFVWILIPKKISSLWVAYNPNFFHGDDNLRRSRLGGSLVLRRVWALRLIESVVLILLLVLVMWFCETDSRTERHVPVLLLAGNSKTVQEFLRSLLVVNTASTFGDLGVILSEKVCSCVLVNCAHLSNENFCQTLRSRPFAIFTVGRCRLLTLFFVFWFVLR